MGAHVIRLISHAVLAASALLLVLGSAPRAFAAPDAEAFVQGIYAHYHGTSTTAPGIMLDSPAALRRYFEPDLAAIMIADDKKADANHDVPTLDGDPFVDAQDWEITDLSIVVDLKSGRRAEAEVHFKNFGESKMVHLQLVRLKAGWRIHDIDYGEGEGTLRGLYK
jgi:hypothetical protein